VGFTDAELAGDLAAEAGRLLLAVRDEVGHDFPYALGDAGDVHANALLLKRLRAERPGDAVLSEEAHDDLARLHADRVWIIDPLDGTKEFIARNGQFTVNIALVRDGAPVLGVVYAPVLDEMFWNVPEQGAWVCRGGAAHRVHVATQTARADQPVRVLASRSHMTLETEAFIRSLGAHEVVQAGSSLKFCRIAEGAADCYPRLGPTCEWDTAAAQAVLEAAGGHVQSLDGVRLGYGKSDVLNPSFVASAWPLRLKGDAA
jgi:3'(2'), 5'-bisphosphate nucleotidase